MLDHPDTFDAVGQDHAEAGAKIEATRVALQAVLDAQDGATSPRPGRWWHGSTGWRRSWRGAMRRSAVRRSRQQEILLPDRVVYCDSMPLGRERFM